MSDIMYTEFESEEIKRFLKNLNTKVKTIKTKYVGLLSAIVYKDIIRHFEQQEGSKGPWKKWSKSYQDAINGKIAFRKSNGRTFAFDPSESGIKPPRKPGKILQDTGHLRQSFKAKNARISGDGILWFNNAKTKSGFPYAAAHDKGGDRLPKRDFMWLSDGAMNAVAYQTLEFITEEGV